MKKIVLLFFASISFSLPAQEKVTADSFNPTGKKKPGNYQALIFDPNGWTFVAEYFFDNKSIVTTPRGDSSKTETIFYAARNTSGNYTYTSIKGNKLIHHGDKRTTAKIIYIDEHLLILEQKAYRPGGIKRRKKNAFITEEQQYIKTRSRIIYKRWNRSTE